MNQRGNAMRSNQNFYISLAKATNLPPHVARHHVVRMVADVERRHNYQLAEQIRLYPQELLKIFAHAIKEELMGVSD